MGEIPKLHGDIRPLIPKLGLRNYWYPAVTDRDVGARKPLKVSLLGEEICLFRGATGGVVAIQDVCPHRGARPSEGACHYRGTVACPYHGWVFDESGKNVAVLSEGPDSGVCGKPGTEAHVYPTRTLKGLVFVWIGDGEPAPIEEDVPEEFFDDALVQVGQVDWKCNWEVALENSMDAHVNYVHRNAVVVARAGFIARGAQGEHPLFVGNGFGGDVAESNYMRRSPRQDFYPNGWKWPKTNYRRFFTWLTRPLAERARRNIPPPRSARWCGGHHLPGMFRAEFGWDLYTRMCVPVDEDLTRLWYYHCPRPKAATRPLWALRGRPCLTDLDPAVHLGLQHRQRQGAVAEELVVEGSDVERGAQRRLGPPPQGQDLQLADLVAERLAGPRHVALDLPLVVGRR